MKANQPDEWTIDFGSSKHGHTASLEANEGIQKGFWQYGYHFSDTYDDVYKGNIFSVTSHLCGEFTGHRRISLHKGQWRGALMFSLIRACMNGLVNNHEVGDLRRGPAHYDVTVMVFHCFPFWGGGLVVIVVVFFSCIGYNQNAKH